MAYRKGWRVRERESQGNPYYQLYLMIYVYIYRVEFSSEEVFVLPLAPLQVSSYLN